MVIAGNAKGKTGIIKEVLMDKSRAIVEGANLLTKHVKPSASNPQGGIEKREGSIHISNLIKIGSPFVLLVRCQHAYTLFQWLLFPEKSFSRNLLELEKAHILPRLSQLLLHRRWQS